MPVAIASFATFGVKTFETFGRRLGQVLLNVWR